jgi:hypothetical protein
MEAEGAEGADAYWERVAKLAAAQVLFSVGRAFEILR